MNLVYKNEKKLFVIAAIIATIFWVALIGGTLGIALIYLLLGYLIFLFAHSGFISYLKGNGVRITEAQYPDLHRRLIQCCEKVGLTEIPEAYLLRTDIFNALATKFLRRHFIVLYTDVVDALEDQPGALDFYIGHEIGHIHRRHLRRNAFLFPAMILPLLGTAYRRAEEYTCDRYGAVCCESDDDVRAAMAAMAAGDTRWKSINTSAYLQQIETTSGFWMSFNELTNDYPWLTKRMATALALRNRQDIQHPRRSVFAWIVAAFVPRLGGGGMASVIVTIAIIGVLAAIAIPAYQDYEQRMSNTVAYQAALPVTDAVSRYVQENDAWPVSLTDLGYDSETLTDATGESAYEIGLYEAGVIGASVGVTSGGEGMYIVLEPTVENGRVTWICFGQNVPERVLPSDCR